MLSKATTYYRVEELNEGLRKAFKDDEEKSFQFLLTPKKRLNI